MELFSVLVPILILHLLGAMSPGPDFIMALKNSLSYGRKTGIYTALGFALGISVHILYCSLGLALIISKSIIAFNIIKFLGSFYLIYIGLKSFFSKTSHTNINPKNDNQMSATKAIRTGFLTNVLNPKATLFFLSMFSFVISPDIPKSTLALASIIMVINTFIWFSVVSIFFTQRKIQTVFEKFQNIFNKIFGILLVSLGIKLASSHK